MTKPIVHLVNHPGSEPETPWCHQSVITRFADTTYDPEHCTCPDCIREVREYAAALGRKTTPGYWVNETSGVLAPVVKKFINSGKLTREEVTVMRAYLRQWVAADGFAGPEVERLRRLVDEVVDHESLHMWMGLAMAAGIDPL